MLNLNHKFDKMSKILTTALLILALAGPLQANIWDNIYSKYDQPDMTLPQRADYVFKLKEFSFLDINLRFLFHAEQERMRISIRRGETMIISGFLDMKGKRVQTVQAKETLCLDKDIPPQAVIDFTDTRNIWRYFSFYEGRVEVDGETMSKYKISIEEIEEKIDQEIPQIYLYFNLNGSLETIQIQLIEESLNFAKERSNSLDKDWTFEARDGCYTNEEDFKKAVDEERKKAFGVTELLNGYFADLIGRFSNRD